MSVFVCPICGDDLISDEKRYVCSSGHSFDISAEGYVNLLPANRKHSKLPGDDKNMVKARNRFLSEGWYESLRAELIKLVLNFSSDSPVILDSGCGEGYYTAGIFESLIEAGKAPQIAGIDISKEAVRLAAKRIKGAEFAVASAYHLPSCDECFDILINCFSPLCTEEFRRVLRKGGYFIYVVPAPRHLWELKCAVYDKPYENERVNPGYEGFSHVDTVKIKNRIFISGRQSVADLFTMTPYFWKTPQEGIDRFKALECLETEISFDIHLYRRI